MNKVVILLLFLSMPIQAQTYDDFFGTGHDVGITISTSDNQGNVDQGHNTINGTGYLPDIYGASRFLAQSTLGADYEQMDYVRQIGIDAWLEEQFQLTGTSYYDIARNVQASVTSEIQAQFGSTAVDEIYWGPDLINISFWQKLITENDYLRQRVALALGEVLVVSSNQIEDFRALGSYYDVLYNNAFGNYGDLLMEVTMHPAMGYYLSHFNNPKTDIVNNIRPDENYAREIMQLFSIGLYELNNDGSQVIDANGNSIPTYNNNHITELAKVFTGISGSAWDLEYFPELATDPVEFGWYAGLYDGTQPMAVYDSDHEQGVKNLLNGYVIPAGQTGLQDVTDAVNHLFNHKNVPPFIAERLIKFLVKSNPTPSYINRVALAFQNNGQGERGDMKAVVRAVLTDPEARDCIWINDVYGGKLREPIIRHTNFLKAFNVSNVSGRYWYRDLWNYEESKQAFLASPSVFNFFTPSYAPAGIVSDNNLIAPEFQILNATTGISMMNGTENSLLYGPIYSTGTLDPADPQYYSYTQGVNDETILDLSDEITTYQLGGATALLDRLDLILCHGQMSSQAKSTIATAIDDMNALGWSGWLTDEMLVKIAIYFVLISPDYTILK